MSRARVMISFGCLVMTAAGARSASAHHEAWVLRDTGMQCAFEAPTGGFEDNYFLGLLNGQSFSRWMSCPVSLSARWASSTPSFPAARWARAASAVVYAVNQQPGTALSCLTQARLGSGALRFSRTVSTTAGGDQKLTPNFDRDWGGDLETFKGDTVRGMDFRCQVPPNYSGVYGYKVRMCIRNSTCEAGDGAAGETWTSSSGGADWVQTSGISCLSSGNPDLARDELGARNVGFGYVSVFCPIVPPADDTKEVVLRRLNSTTVFYRGPNGDPFNEPPPTCQLMWRNRPIVGTFVMEEFASPAFTQNQFFEEVRLGSANVGVEYDGTTPRADLALMVLCDLPPNYAIKGIVSNITVAPVSSGF